MKRRVREIVLAILASLVMSSTLPASASSIDDQGLWYFDWDRVQDVHDSGITGEGVTIAMIDSPVNVELPTLADADIRPQEPVCVDKQGRGIPSTSTDFDLTSHGTAVLSFLVGSGEGFPGQTGVKGVAPDATVLTFPTLVEDKGRDCTGTLVSLDDCWIDATTGECREDASNEPTELTASEEVGQSIHEAIDAGADIVSVSIGVLDTGVLTRAVARAIQEGVIIVAAVPNRDDGSSSMPADLNGVVSVNSITKDERANYSRHTDVVAPGDELLFQGVGGDWTSQELARGTSFATPIVTGNLALAMQKYPDATPNQLIQSMIHNTGDQSHDLSFDPTYGYGLLITDVFVNSDPTAYPDVNPLVTALDGQWPRVDEIWEGAIVSDQHSADVVRPWPAYTPESVAPGPSPGTDAEAAPSPGGSPTTLAEIPSETSSSWLIPPIIIGALMLAAIAAGAVIIITTRSTRTTGESHGIQ